MSYPAVRIIDESGRITLPKIVFQEHEWDSGDEITISSMRGRIFLGLWKKHSGNRGYSIQQPETHQSDNDTYYYTRSAIDEGGRITLSARIMEMHKCGPGDHIVFTGSTDGMIFMEVTGRGIL